MLYLHIGRGKSGSTTIQHTTLANRDTLAAHGILCPDGAARHKGHYAQLARALQAQQPPPSEIRDLLSSAPDTNFFVSSEFLFGLRSRDIETVRSITEPHAVTIIAYVRDYPSWIRSLYMQATKTGKNLLDFDSYYDRMLSQTSVRAPLANWAEVFGWPQMVVRPMGSALAAGDLIQDLSELLGVSLVAIPDKNASPHWLEIEFVRALHIHDPEPGRLKSSPQDVRAALKIFRFCIQQFTIPNAEYLTTKQRHEIIGSFNDDAKWIEAHTGRAFSSLAEDTGPERTFLPTLNHAPDGLIAMFQKRARRSPLLAGRDHAKAVAQLVSAHFKKDDQAKAVRARDL